ncbi:hypothetical protein TNCV_3073851 [Trichonephila clavipes]|nr:hypothetical protein TNCV_3073851 [Trichonephila clavipes]
MKTAIWAVYFHLLSSNDSPQHGLCPEIINACCKFQKIEDECNERHYVIMNDTCAIYHNELNEADPGGRDSVEADEHAGRPRSATTDQNIAKIRDKSDC